MVRVQYFFSWISALAVVGEYLQVDKESSLRGLRLDFWSTMVSSSILINIWEEVNERVKVSKSWETVWN